MIMNNLLNTAFQIIPKQKILFYSYLGNTVTDGLLEPTYNPQIEIEGSVQAVSMSSKVYNGFNTSKEVLQFYLRLDASIVSGVSSKGSSKVVFKAKEYILEEMTSWYLIDGWVHVYGVLNG